MTLSFKNSEPAPAGLDQAPRNDWQSPPWNRWSFQHVGDFLDVVPVAAEEVVPVVAVENY